MTQPARRGAALLGFAALLLSAAAPGAARAADGTGALRLIPAGADAVVALNVDRFRGSPYYQTLIGWLQNESDFAAGAELLEKEIGFDVKKDVATLVFAGEVGQKKGEQFVLLVRGRYDLKELMKAARQGGRSAKHRRVGYVVNPDDVAIAAVGKYLAVASSAERMKKVIDVYRRKARPIRRDQSVMALVRHTDTGKDLWFALEIGPELSKEMTSGAPMMRGVEGVSASLDLEKGLGLEMRLATESARVASTLQSTLSQAVQAASGNPSLGQLLGKLGVSRRREAVELSLDLTARELTTLVGSVGAMPL